MVNEELAAVISCFGCITSLTLVCYLAREVSRKVLSTSLQYYSEEAICTFQVVAGCMEGDVILETLSYPGLFAYIFLLFVSFGMTFGGAGCPCNTWEDTIRGRVSLLKCIVANIVQVAGGLLGPLFVKAYWWMSLSSYDSSMFRRMKADICDSAMKSTLVGGMAAEFLATFSFSVYANLGLLPASMASYGDAFVTAVIVIIGMDWTGMMFNPALATALTYNCRGHTLTEHALVYWTAPLLASLLSCHLFRRAEHKAKRE